MSNLTEREIACVYCKQPMVVGVWSSVNVKEDPELKDLLLGGELNLFECAACKELFHLDSFLLYHDPDNEILAFVYAENEELRRDLLEEKMKGDFEVTQATMPDNQKISYAPVCLKGLNELLAFVERDDEVALQGEVCEAIARENHIPIRKINPFLSRQQKLPRILPFLAGNDGDERQAVLAGLEKLHGLNNRLTVYNEVLARLKANDKVGVVFQ